MYYLNVAADRAMPSLRGRRCVPQPARFRGLAAVEGRVAPTQRDSFYYAGAVIPPRTSLDWFKGGRQGRVGRVHFAGRGRAAKIASSEDDLKDRNARVGGWVRWPGWVQSGEWPRSYAQADEKAPPPALAVPVVRLPRTSTGWQPASCPVIIIGSLRDEKSWSDG